jgi:hypothetical protein
MSSGCIFNVRDYRKTDSLRQQPDGIDKYYDRIVNGMMERGYEKDFAESIFQQIHGFGEYGFPESHAASFALLVYASSWLKCHEPEAFLVAMLNSMPLGFYSASQFIEDAQRHNVKVLPADVTISNWNSVLERHESASRPAVRLGLSLLKGMKDGAAERIEAARAVRQFASPLRGLQPEKAHQNEKERRKSTHQIEVSAHKGWVNFRCKKWVSFRCKSTRQRQRPRQTCAARPQGPSGPRRGELAVFARRQPVRSTLGVSGCGT